MINRELLRQSPAWANLFYLKVFGPQFSVFSKNFLATKSIENPSKFSITGEADSSELTIQCENFFLSREVSELAASNQPSILTFVREQNQIDAIMITSKTMKSDVLLAVHEGEFIGVYRIIFDHGNK